MAHVLAYSWDTCGLVPATCQHKARMDLVAAAAALVYGTPEAAEKFLAQISRSKAVAYSWPQYATSAGAQQYHVFLHHVAVHVAHAGCCGYVH